MTDTCSVVDFSDTKEARQIPVLCQRGVTAKSYKEQAHILKQMYSNTLDWLLSHSQNLHLSLFWIQTKSGIDPLLF